MSVSPMGEGSVMRSLLTRALQVARGTWETLRHRERRNDDTRVTDQDVATGSLSFKSSLSFVLTRGGRRWAEMWQDMIRQHSDLAAIYAGSIPEISTHRQREVANHFFLCCHH